MNTINSDTTILASEQADSKDEIVHHILCSVEKDAGLSQRQLAQELNIALGSVNWCLKRCINKGLIKIQQAPLKRYMYYLTPQGFDEKSRLTAQYLKHSFQLFRLGRVEAADILGACKSANLKSVYLIGDSDLAEIFILSAYESGMEVSGILDDQADAQKRVNVTIYKSKDELPSAADHMCFIVTDLHNPAQAYQLAKSQCEERGLSFEHIFVPKLLNFNPESARQGDGV